MKRLLLASLAAASIQAQAFDKNPYLSSSHWTSSHGNSWASGATDQVVGPKTAAQLGSPSYLPLDVINITLLATPKYPDGRMTYWGSSARKVYKLRVDNGKLVKVDEEFKDGQFNFTVAKTPTSGAYTLLSFENVFYTVLGKTIYAYTDVTNSASSAIKLRNKVDLTSYLDAEDAFVALNMTYNGYIAFATKRGKVGVIDRGLTTTPKIVTLRETDDTSSAATNISNSIATDRTGGIFVVTSKRMHRIQWDGSQLYVNNGVNGAWSTKYEADPTLCKTGNGGRLGEGSGTTPTIMGEGSQQFVVINDCAKKNNLAMFWLGAIPNDWTAITGTTTDANGVQTTEVKDRRFAAQVPVDFGDGRSSIYSEQSPLAYGNGIVVVSNDYNNTGGIQAAADLITPLLPANIKELASSVQNFATQLVSGRPLFQPWGMAKYEWNTATRKLEKKWSKLDVSCPNSIPTMSVQANTIYCVGAYNKEWTIEGINWTDGARAFRKNIASSVSLPIGENIKYNSFYSATEVAADGGMIYGTLSGVAYLPPVK